MIDVSDGLALDLHRLADASGVGFRLDEVRRPTGRPSTRPSAAARTTSWCSQCSATDVDGLVWCASSRRGCGVPARVGTVVADPALRLFGDGPLERLGWQHRLG